MSFVRVVHLPSEASGVPRDARLTVVALDDMRGLTLRDSTDTAPELTLMTPRSNPADGSLPVNRLLVDILEAAGIDNTHAEWPDDLTMDAYLVTVVDDAEYDDLTVPRWRQSFPTFRRLNAALYRNTRVKKSHTLATALKRLIPDAG
jgi:hypothetical protein